eukprot:scaffold2043_cov375-Prasinococcus_capsulatus_cf.AAC.3
MGAPAPMDIWLTCMLFASALPRVRLACGIWAASELCACICGIGRTGSGNATRAGLWFWNWCSAPPSILASRSNYPSLFSSSTLQKQTG